jgi:hypothetical protein
MAFTGFNNIRPPKAEMRKYVPVKREVAEAIGESVTMKVHLTMWDWGEQDWNNPESGSGPQGIPVDNNNREPLPDTVFCFDVTVNPDTTLFDVLLAMADLPNNFISGYDGVGYPPEFEEAANMDPGTAGSHPFVKYLSAMRVPPIEMSEEYYYDVQEGYIENEPDENHMTFKGVSWVYFLGDPAQRPGTINELPQETIDLMVVSSENCEFTFSYDAFELVFEV